MILVTGATGTNGMELIKQLSAAGAPVRAMSRRPSASTPGVDWVAADFDDPASLHAALEGVERAFLVTNSSERAEEQQLRFVQLAHAAGVQHIVYLSQLHAALDSPVRFLHYHAVVEAALRASGMQFTNLRPNLFMQGLLDFRQMIVGQGRFFAPAGDAKVSIVDVRDIAAVAAAALIQSDHEGQTYDLTGPEPLTHAEMADRLAEALEIPVAFTDVPDEAARQALAGFGFPQWQADGLIEDYQHYRRGEASAVSNTIEAVTGQPPRTFAAFARDYRDAFRT